MRSLVPASSGFLTRRWPGWRGIVALAVCLLITAVQGCAKKDLKSELDRTRSWTATTRLAVDRRAAGATNAAVTTQILQRANEAQSESRQSLAELATTDSARAAARVVLDSLHDGILQLERGAR